MSTNTCRCSTCCAANVYIFVYILIGAPIVPLTYLTLLCCIVLCCVVLYCLELYCVVLCCVVLYCVVLCCVVLYCVVLCCVVMCCIVLYCIVLYCIVLNSIMPCVQVNSAGILSSANITDNCDLAEYDRIMLGNTKSMLMVTKYAVPHLIHTKGSSFVASYHCYLPAYSRFALVLCNKSVTNSKHRNPE